MTRMLSLSDFEGVWLVEREIIDRNGPDGRFEGQAVFSPVAAGLSYVEDGRLVLEGRAAVTASQRYVWRGAEAGRIAVEFADSRPFHDFALKDVAEADHFCDPDTYRVTYRFDAWPEWQAEWRVLGPQKDYRLKSHYRRPE